MTATLPDPTRPEPLETFLRRGAGRCRSCGFHPTTQGHGPDCPRGKR